MISRAALRAVLALDDHNDPRYWAIRWQYHKGDGFYDDLLRAAAHADPENLARISRGFAAIAVAVNQWKNVDGWAQKTEAWAESIAGGAE